jgi:hypothetical protein
VSLLELEQPATPSTATTRRATKISDKRGLMRVSFEAQRRCPE